MVLAVVIGLAALAQSQTFTTLHNFTGGSDGARLYTGVIQDPSGNLYGTTELGGDYQNCDPGFGCGVVYKLDTSGRVTALHSFSGNPDGTFPITSVARDGKGDLYGTTQDGGTGSDGTVFKIDTGGNETVLYSFTGGSDGCYPNQGLIGDKAGNSYGTTYGCNSSYGTIFKIDSAGNFTLLHSFAGGSSDGASPVFGHLTIDQSGNLYGVTGGGGVYNHGVLYQLSTSGTLIVLHSFVGDTSDGCYPFGSVVQDKAGNLYGTTSSCGSNDAGTIWKMSPTGAETILHNFAGGGLDGCNPEAGVARDSKGNLYGVTVGCGANGYGAVYELSAGGKLRLLHSFDFSDGSNPYGEVTRTRKGTLFGTTEFGGIYDYGTVWSYVP
jgi:uncharacterized repeat protein (TIGR03803 family)